MKSAKRIPNVEAMMTCNSESKKNLSFLKSFLSTADFLLFDGMDGGSWMADQCCT